MNATLVLDTGDAAELATDFALQRPWSSEAQDLARYYEALAKVRTIR
jgi:hypothetical protein